MNRCECGRYSVDAVCSYCLTGEEPPPASGRRSALEGPAPEPVLRYRYDDEPAGAIPVRLNYRSDVLIVVRPKSLL